MKIGNVLSLFDGMSCLQIALNRAGIEYENYYASEIKKHAIKVTQGNYPETIQIGDVCKVKGSDLPEIELMAFGSPCQDFSSANSQRLGLAGAKSSLFYEALRLLHEVKPKYFLMENVRMNGRDYEIISRELGMYPIRINSGHFGPMQRDRMYWFNFGPVIKDLFGFPKIDIPMPKRNKIRYIDILENGYVPDKKATTLLASNDSSPHASKFLFVRRNLAPGIGFGHPVFESEQNYKDCFNLFRNCDFEQMKITEPELVNSIVNKVRFLTQTELERLQTVPEGYTKSVTRNQAANLLGDGWTIDVISHILNFLKK